MLVETSGGDVPYAFRRFVVEASRLLAEFEGLVGMPVLPVIMSRIGSLIMGLSMLFTRPLGA